LKRRKSNHGARLAWIALAVLFVAIAGTFVAATVWFDSYLRSRELLELVTGLTGRSFHSDARIEPLRWTGSSAFTEQVGLTGRPGSVVREVAASQVRAELNWRAAFSGIWRVDEISMTQFDGDFGPPGAADGAEVQPVAPKPSGLAALLPRKFELGQAKIAAANIAYEQARATSVRLLVTPDGVGWRFDGNGGTLNVPFLPALEILHFRAREQGGDFFLTESALGLGESGKISASGESGGDGLLRVSWTGIRSRDVLDAKVQNHLEGKLSGSAEIRPPGSVRGKFQLVDGRVENVKALAAVADFTGNPSFRRMPLQEMSSDFSYENGVLQLTAFIAESKGLLRVEGAGRLAPDGKIEGRFQIGVTPQTLQWLPGSRERVFTVARNGYLWTELVLGGTLENPTEDLTARLTRAMGGAVIEQGAGLIKEAPAKAIDGAKTILDSFIGPLAP